MPFTIERNDLAKMNVDAIVVAANEELQITGGVGLVVGEAAGLAQLQAACDRIGGCHTGSAVATPGFALPAHTIIHAVGPVWHGGISGEATLLRSAYTSALQLAADQGARSIALPLISAGTYGFPPDLALSIAREAIRAFLDVHEADVHLVLYSREAVSAGLAAYADIAEYIDDHYVEEHPGRQRERREEERGRQEFAPLPGYQAAPSMSSDRQAAPSMPPDHQATSGVSPNYQAAPSTPPSYQAAPSMPPVSPASSAPAASPSYGVSLPPSYAQAASQEPSAKPKKPGVLSRIGEALGNIGRPRESAQTQRFETDLEVEDREAAVLPPDVTGEFAMPSFAPMEAPAFNLEAMLDNLDAPFSTTLLALIDARGMTDVEVYKRANMSRQLFSRIRSDEAYRPTKKTALALAIALRLNLPETSDLLRRAGYALSNSSKADVIVEYFIRSGIYDIFEINEALYAFDQPIL